MTSILWTADRIAAIAAGVAFLIFLRWFFFGGRRREQRATVRPGSGANARGAAEQEATIVVSGGYDPDVVVAKKGVPLNLIFDRREANPCSDEVVLPEFGIRQSLAANAKTTIRIVPKRVGEFPFACGMNMLHGLLRVEE